MHFDEEFRIPKPDYMKNVEQRTLNLTPVIVVFFGLIVVYHLANALVGKSFYRPQHLGTALEYAHGKIDMMKPVIVGFNANGSPTPQEFPLWQALAGLAFKITKSSWYGWANLVSLILFATGLWPFFQLARQYVGERAAKWTLIIFLAEPLIIVYAGKAATDGFCLVVMLWFLFFANLMIQSGQLRWWPPVVLFACLGLLSKLPFFMVAGLVAVQC